MARLNDAKRFLWIKEAAALVTAGRVTVDVEVNRAGIVVTARRLHIFQEQESISWQNFEAATVNPLPRMVAAVAKRVRSCG